MDCQILKEIKDLAGRWSSDAGVRHALFHVLQVATPGPEQLNFMRAAVARASVKKNGGKKTFELFCEDEALKEEIYELEQKYGAYPEMAELLEWAWADGQIEELELEQLRTLSLLYADELRAAPTISAHSPIPFPTLDFKPNLGRKKVDPEEDE